MSPYITECPYCGHRLRRRAPKLPRGGGGKGPKRSRGTVPSLGRLRRGEIPGIRAESRPYATIALVLASAVLWVAWHGGYVGLDRLLVLGPLHGDWWRLLSSQFAYENGFYEFAVVLPAAVFGFLLERRHGPALVLALFLGSGVLGVLATLAIYPDATLGGANGPALALLAAWAAPDVLAAARGGEYEGDLLGVGAFAILLLALPLAREDVSWVSGLTGLLLGALVGCGLARGFDQ